MSQAQCFGNKELSKTHLGLSKAVYYPTDGTGRDSYITHTNGGLCAPHQLAGAADVGTLRSKSFVREAMPRMNAKNLFYAPNGTGRDSYIVNGSGGFCPPGQTAAYKCTFVEQLRSWNRPASATQRITYPTKKEKKDFYRQS